MTRGWSAFGGADHGWQNVGLERRAWALAPAVSGSVGSQGAAADVSGEQKYYLANLPAKADLRTLAATIKARWICEQAHQQLKEELCLDHFEGRSWQGLLRHALMTMIAYAFLQHRPYSIGALAGFTIPP